VSRSAATRFRRPTSTPPDASHITAAFPAAAKVIPPTDQTDGAGRVQVTVTLKDGETSAANINSWFTYVDKSGSSQPLPTVTGVHNYAGPEAGGNTVDVYGRRLLR